MQSCIENQERHHAAIDLGFILSLMVSYINEFSWNHISRMKTTLLLSGENYVRN